MQFVTGRCIQIGFGNFALHLIADFVQKRRTLGVYFQLNIQKLFQKLIRFIWIFVHNLLHGFTFNKIKDLYKRQY